MEESVLSQTQLPVSKKKKEKIVERLFGHWRFQVSINANESDTCGINFSGSKKRCCEFLLLDQKMGKGQMR